MLDSKRSYPFEAIVRQFITECCVIKPEASVPDSALFAQFRTFWSRRAHEARYPALLGQFRVTMTQLGFPASGGKKPQWHGLTLKDPLLKPSSSTGNAQQKSPVGKSPQSPPLPTD